MSKKREHLGDRPDGILLRDLDSLHFITGIIYPNRCDNEAYISETIDLTNINAFLERKNADHPPYKYNLFQLIVTALVKTITLRPKMNRFIVNSNFFIRLTKAPILPATCTAMALQASLAECTRAQ